MILLLSAALASVSEPAFEALEPIPAAAQGEAIPACTVDRRWCALIETDETQERQVLRLYDGLPGGRAPVASHLIESENSEGFWRPSAILRRAESDDVILGADMELQAMYSGGGGMSSYRTLVRFTPGAAPQEMLTVPMSGSLMIRACFGEEDMKQRAGACHDEYEFNAELKAEGDAFPPRLTYASTATTFPGPVSRNEDSLAKPPLTPKDLVKAVDAECSVRRVFTFDPAANAYVPDAPLPDCGDYTVP
ncbi:Uncharacterised protein [Brevundimonas diminuta]|uniref:hypothetical protein n=1 Tax=Brevundimonas diminuta TaxID=293 RepID=UPI000207F266|nr:hypothetical protein [Brevundimonas diminuta]EGF95384.1 hypothetical protein BDIM_22220 [Brevundimonas diminuta ATCC 11568]OWR19890.1 hypothetical protein CD944_08950 [Brevundimonas diminuta]WQE45817.1 hypothetical protein U0020_02940 [Brevundimonas diminuta]SPU47433.1 Uncharacterised protein [Brevundimonas diminuta]SUW15044.1 Uncharacterised protein [Brevundimonas diminuta]